MNDDLRDALQDELLGPEPDWEAEPAPPDGQARANAMLHRVAAIRAGLAEAEEVAAVELDSTLAWLNKRRERAAREEAWLMEALRRYLDALRSRDGRLSQELPRGKLVSRMGQPSWDFVDEEAFLTWAAKNLPEAVRPPKVAPPEIDRPAAKKHLTRRDEKGDAVAYGVTTHGEHPPGLVVHPPERAFDIKLRSEEDDA